jgi:polyisoprenoid-binding protein YceI
LNYFVCRASRSYSLTARFMSAVLLLLCAPTVSPAEVTGTATVHFTGTSNLHDFEGTAPPIAVEPTDGENGWHAEVRLPVAGLDTGNRSRDRKMRELLEADSFPDLVAIFEDTVPETLAGGSEAGGTLSFRLRIRDIEKSISARVENFTRSEDRASFDAVFPVSLAGFGLEAPSALFFIKVEDRIDVRVTVTLERS